MRLLLIMVMVLGVSGKASEPEEKATAYFSKIDPLIERIDPKILEQIKNEMMQEHKVGAYLYRSEYISEYDSLTRLADRLKKTKREKITDDDIKVLANQIATSLTKASWETHKKTAEAVAEFIRTKLLPEDKAQQEAKRKAAQDGTDLAKMKKALEAADRYAEFDDISTDIKDKEQALRMLEQMLDVAAEGRYLEHKLSKLHETKGFCGSVNQCAGGAGAGQAEPPKGKGTHGGPQSLDDAVRPKAR